MVWPQRLALDHRAHRHDHGRISWLARCQAPISHLRAKIAANAAKRAQERARADQFSLVVCTALEKLKGLLSAILATDENDVLREDDKACGRKKPCDGG